MSDCKACGGLVDPALGACAACGAPAELGRLTGILGRVCRACDAYNEPGAKACAACGAPLGSSPSLAGVARPPGVAGPAPAGPPAAPAPPDAPLVRAFPKGGGPATRFVPPVKVAPPEPPLHTPVPTPRCPRCGEDAGAGPACARCGHHLGARGTRILSRRGRGGDEILAAVAPGRVRVVVERGEGREGDTIPLDAASVEAGRTRGPVSFPRDPCLAPHHATFVFRDDEVHVRDEGAPGGVFLRLRGLTVPLRPGDAFVVGDRLLRLAGPLPPPPEPPPDGTHRLGAPRPAAPAIVLEEWLEGGVPGRVFVRAGRCVTIGRAGCAVSLGDDPHLSQAHAELLVDAAGAVRLRDLSSSNGTYVRVPPHAERALRDGDFVRMGRAVLRVAFA